MRKSGTHSRECQGPLPRVTVWSIRKHFRKNFNPLSIICIAKCIIVHRGETAFLTHGCPPWLMDTHKWLRRIQEVFVSPISVNFPSCMESAESLVLMIQSSHLGIHLVMTARQTLGVQFPALAAQFIYIEMMKNQLDNVIQTNKSHIQI